MALTVLLLSALFLPVLSFATLGLLKSTHTRDTTTFYRLGGRAEDSAYTHSTIAYMLQTVTTFYFIYWGYHYGLGNIFYVLSWLCGIYLFEKFSKPLAQWSMTHQETLPQLLSGIPGNHYLKLLSSFVTFLGFTAMIYLETYYAAKFGTEIVRIKAESGEAFLWWLLFLTFLGVGLTYSLFGGLSKVYYTDEKQLTVAYLGFSATFVYLLNRSFLHAPLNSLVIGLTIIMVLLIFLREDWRLGRFGPKFYALTIAAFCITLVVFRGIANAGISQLNTDQSLAGLLSQLTEPNGWITLAGFTLLNLGWQFCDQSNYQRIGSISDPQADFKRLSVEIQSAIRSTRLASPLTWSFGIFLGMLIRTADITPQSVGLEADAFLSSIYANASAGGGLALLGIVGFTLAISSIMLSTIDSCIVTIMQVVEVDILRRNQTSLLGRLMIGLALLTLLILFAFMNREMSQDDILILINAAYAQLFALSIPAIVRLLKIKAQSSEIGSSIVLASVATWCSIIWAPDTLDPNIALVLPTFACIAGGLAPMLHRIIQHATLEFKKRKAT